jgi:hypothetical protein
MQRVVYSSFFCQNLRRMHTYVYGCVWLSRHKRVHALFSHTSLTILRARKHELRALSSHSSLMILQARIHRIAIIEGVPF